MKDKLVTKGIPTSFGVNRPVLWILLKPRSSVSIGA